MSFKEGTYLPCYGNFQQIGVRRKHIMDIQFEWDDIGSVRHNPLPPFKVVKPVEEGILFMICRPA
jgi:hypothetical protein